jgi:hypothetical protein
VQPGDAAEADQGRLNGLLIRGKQDWASRRVVDAVSAQRTGPATQERTLLYRDDGHEATLQLEDVP